MSEQDTRFMERVIELARAAAPRTSPNPRVGAVITRGDVVVSEGAHQGPGTPHAEAMALSDVDAAGTTMYVNLEPCVHQGRTPPCLPLLLDAGVSRLVVGTTDPDERVSGAGLAAARAAGLEVTTGILERECRLLNASYLHHRSTGRSFFTLKLALSLDGCLAAADGSSRWISDPAARAVVHARRAEVDAVLVGAGTVAKDDPSLTVRDVPGATQPVRVIADASGRIPPTARVFDAAAPAIVATTDRCPHDVQVAWKESGAEVVVLPAARDGVPLTVLTEEFGRRGFLEILCEGGAALATSALHSELVDRLEIHRGPMFLGGSGVRLGDLGVGSIDEAQRWTLVEHRSAGNTSIATYMRGF